MEKFKNLTLHSISKSQRNTTLTEIHNDPLHCLAFQFRLDADLTRSIDEDEIEEYDYYEMTIKDFNQTTLGLVCAQKGCKARMNLGVRNFDIVKIPVKQKLNEAGEPMAKKRKLPYVTIKC